MLAGICFGCENKLKSNAISITVDVDKAKAIELTKTNWLKNQSFTLDVTENSLIGDIDDVITFDSLFLIRTHGKLVKFDYTGKYDGNISMMGQAGNEYIGVNSIWYKGDTLYIYDMNGKKVLLYSLDNKLIATIRLSSKASSNPFQMLIPFHKGYIGKMIYKGENTQSPELAYYNDDCSFQHTIGKTSLTSGLTLGYSFSKYDKMVLYWRQLGNFIYSIDESFAINKRYYIDFGRKNIPYNNPDFKDEYDIITFVNAAPPNRYAGLLSNVIEGKKYVIFCFISNAKKYLTIYDKTSGYLKTLYFTNSIDELRVIDVRPISENQIMIFSLGEADNGIVYIVSAQQLIDSIKN